MSLVPQRRTLGLDSVGLLTLAPTLAVAVLCTALALRYPATAFRSLLLLGALAMLLGAVALPLAAWQLHRAAATRQPDRVMRRRGAGFLAAFAGHNLLWGGLSALLATWLVRYELGSWWGRALLTGAAACAAVSILGVLVFQRTRGLSVCWRHFAPTQCSPLGWSALTLLLRERYHHARALDLHAPQSELVQVTRWLDCSSTGEIPPQVLPRQKLRPSLPREVTWRLKSLALVFTCAALLGLAFLPLFKGLPPPVESQIAQLTGATPPAPPPPPPPAESLTPPPLGTNPLHVAAGETESPPPADGQDSSPSLGDPAAATPPDGPSSPIASAASPASPGGEPGAASAPATNSSPIAQAGNPPPQDPPACAQCDGKDPTCAACQKPGQAQPSPSPGTTPASSPPPSPSQVAKTSPASQATPPPPPPACAQCQGKDPSCSACQGGKKPGGAGPPSQTAANADKPSSAGQPPPPGQAKPPPSTAAKPPSDCAQCQGKNPASCSACQGGGKAGAGKAGPGQAPSAAPGQPGAVQAQAGNQPGATPTRTGTATQAGDQQFTGTPQAGAPIARPELSQKTGGWGLGDPGIVGPVAAPDYSQVPIAPNPAPPNRVLRIEFPHAEGEDSDRLKPLHERPPVSVRELLQAYDGPRPDSLPGDKPEARPTQRIPNWVLEFQQAP